MKRQQTAAEYLHQFLPTGFQLRLRVEDDIDRFGRKTAAEASNGVNCCKFCNSSKFRQEDCPDAPQSSEEDGSL